MFRLNPWFYSWKNIIILLGLVIVSLFVIIGIIYAGLYVLLNTKDCMPFFDVIVGCTVAGFLLQ